MVEKQIRDAFQQFNKLNILIIGDVMIDAYMWGKVERISPEAPVPVISITGQEERLGGAANVALNVQSLGATPVMCAVIGNDAKGAIFKNLLEINQMPSKGIMISEKRKTTVKTRVISHNQHLLRIDDELDKPLTPELENEFKVHINQLFGQYQFHAVIFEDYDKGNITPAIINHVVKKATTLKIATLVDPKKRNFENYKGVTLFKPNFKEICEGLKTDIPKGNFDALNQAALKLLEKLEAKYIMVTLSELGVFITNSKGYHRLPAQIRDIADVSGAGDTVISVASCCLATGLSPEIIAYISNIAGGLVCEKVGVVPVDKAQLLAETLKCLI
jgi:D-glycero-beta-D-manno-heptose-7-phosphate kinase